MSAAERRSSRPCYHRGGPAESEAGPIFVRRRGPDGSYASVPICDSCWVIEMGDRVPVRVRPQ